MGSISPQRYATANNALLVVGNMDDSGHPFENAPVEGALDGSSPNLQGKLARVTMRTNTNMP